MSHRLDSPIARQDIRLNITDLYLFRGGTGTTAEIADGHSCGLRSHVRNGRSFLLHKLQ